MKQNYTVRLSFRLNAIAQVSICESSAAIGPVLLFAVPSMANPQIDVVVTVKKFGLRQLRQEQSY